MTPLKIYFENDLYEVFAKNIIKYINILYLGYVIEIEGQRNYYYF